MLIPNALRAWVIGALGAATPLLVRNLVARKPRSAITPQRVRDNIIWKRTGGRRAAISLAKPGAPLQVCLRPGREPDAGNQSIIARLCLSC